MAPSVNLPNVLVFGASPRAPRTVRIQRRAGGGVEIVGRLSAAALVERLEAQPSCDLLGRRTSALAEELGDFLLQAVFVAEITRAEGSFDIDDVITAIHDKLVRRHPHVFGEVEAKDAEQVLVNWEKLKNEERKAENKSVLAGVPQSLPALLKASRLTEKAARVGFDWRRAEGVLAKIDEEVGELREAVASDDGQSIHDEIGDLLFSITNIARKLDVNAEEALQSANRKFLRRFESMERAVRSEGRNLDQLTLEQMDALWDEAKAAERL